MKKILASLLLGFGCFSGFAQWNSNTSINLEVDSLNSSDLHALSTQDGKTWIAFYSQNGSGYNMRAQLLDSAGNKLLGTNGVLVDSFSSGSATYVFNTCIDKTGNLIITAQDQRAPTLQAVAFKIDQTGASLWNGGSGVVLGTGLSPYPAVLSNGDVVIAWSNSNVVNIQKISNTGVSLWTTPIAFTTAVGHPSRGQLIPISDTNFLMVYQQGSFGINSTLYAQLFDGSGSSMWANPVQLSNEATSLARYYNLKQDADTAYLGYYSSSMSNHFNSWLQRINPDGTLPYGINGAAFSDYSGGSDPLEQTTNIALSPNSNFVWAVSTFSNSVQSESGIYVQKFKKSDGTRLLNVDGKEVYPISSLLQNQVGDLTLKDDHPVFIFSNQQNYLIKGTILDDTGAFILPTQDVELSSTMITQPSSMTKGRFAFTQNVNGQSVAVWTENRGVDTRAYAQNFDLSVYDTSLIVTTQNAMSATITTLGGTLQMEATVLPATASQNVIWSIIPGTGTASISTSGLVTAITNGTVWAKAVSTAAPSYTDSLEITISNQITGIKQLATDIGLNIYPNPVSDILEIQLNNAHPDLTLSLTDIQGRNLQTVKINKQTEKVTMNMKQYSSGTYFLKIAGKNVNLVEKIARK